MTKQKLKNEQARTFDIFTCRPTDLLRAVTTDLSFCPGCVDFLALEF